MNVQYIWGRCGHWWHSSEENSGRPSLLVFSWAFPPNGEGRDHRTWLLQHLELQYTYLSSSAFLCHSPSDEASLLIFRQQCWPGCSKSYKLARKFEIRRNFHFLCFMTIHHRSSTSSNNMLNIVYWKLTTKKSDYLGFLDIGDEWRRQVFHSSSLRR